MFPVTITPHGEAHLMDGPFTPIEAAAVFHEEKAAKVDLARGHHLFLGLNCFEAGQSQPVHHHSGTDKFYLIVSGKARMIVGDRVDVADAGTLVWAPADVPHGVVEALERTVMVVGMAPPPAP